MHWYTNAHTHTHSSMCSFITQKYENVMSNGCEKNDNMKNTLSELHGFFRLSCHLDAFFNHLINWKSLVTRQFMFPFIQQASKCTKHISECWKRSAPHWRNEMYEMKGILRQTQTNNNNNIIEQKNHENKAAYARINMIGDRVWKAPTTEQS